MSIDALARRNIRTLAPYRSARQDAHKGVLLDANENALGSVSLNSDDNLNRYPDPFQRNVRREIGLLERTNPSNIFAGVGSDEVIDLLLRVFCEPRQDRILILEPTYGMYAVSAAIQDVAVESVRLDEGFQIDIPKTRNALLPSVKLIFCCSPNNPTGNLLRRDDVLSLCASTDSLVVVDEAYVDFSGAPSLSADVTRTPNLVVMKTFSKSWGLAGIRLGYCIAHEDVVAYLDKVKPPYNISTLTSKAALHAITNVQTRDRLVGSIVAERFRVATALASISSIEKVFPSDANFLLVRCRDHVRVLSTLRSAGIIIRDRSTQQGLDRCLRITIGTPEENTLLLDVLTTIDRDNRKTGS